jgi:acyl carrier protein
MADEKVLREKGQDPYNKPTQSMKAAIVALLNEIQGKHTVPETVPDDSNLVTDFGLNSLDMMNFILQIEEQFKVSIDLENFDLDYFNNLSLLVQYIGKLQTESPHA